MAFLVCTTRAGAIASANVQPAKLGTSVSSTAHRCVAPKLSQFSGAALPLKVRNVSKAEPRRSHVVAATEDDYPYPWGKNVESLPLPATWIRQNDQRVGGVLLHPSSLPGNEALGTLGKEAHAFVDWMADAGLGLWQILPLVPPDKDGSPYSSSEAFAGSPWLIDITELVRLGLLPPEDLPVGEKFTTWADLFAKKGALLSKAARALLDGKAFSDACSVELLTEFEDFKRQYTWLREAALFAVATNYHPGQSWWEWPVALRDRDPTTLAIFEKKFAGEIAEQEAIQFLFERQWQALKKHANSVGIRLVGDMPIYVGAHCTSVWAHQELFTLDPVTKAPVAVSGVPPDLFSADGQLWGSPLYKWEAHKAENFKWWVERLKRNFQLADICRIDHFRAFAGYYNNPANAPNARNGHWEEGPGLALFEACQAALGGAKVPIIAEDLGFVTEDVVKLREDIGAPGMLVLQFAWGGANPSNVYLPHNHYSNAFVYPGTHDNDTCVGWWKGLPEADKAFMRKYLRYDGNDIEWEMIRTAFKSPADSAVIAMQDYLGLDGTNRMNMPGQASGNWTWTMKSGATSRALAARIRYELELTNRLPRKEEAKIVQVRNRGEEANWDNVVLNKDADVVILMFAPWCKHCNAFEPKYEQVARQLAGQKGLVFANIDITQNNRPDGDFGAKTIPQVYVVSGKDNKVSKIEWKGGKSADTSVDDVVKFIKANRKLA